MGDRISGGRKRGSEKDGEEEGREGEGERERDFKDLVHVGAGTCVVYKIGQQTGHLRKLIL